MTSTGQVSARGFILRLYQLDRSLLGEQRFAALPIRIGRSSLNDFEISHKLVSEFHARIEEIDGKLCVRDLSSKNGIFVTEPGKDAAVAVAAQTALDLEPYGYEFLLSPLLRVRLSPAPAEEMAAPRRSHAQGSVLGNPRLLNISGESAVPEDAFTASFVMPRGPSTAPAPAAPVAAPPAVPAAAAPAPAARAAPAPPAPVRSAVPAPAPAAPAVRTAAPFVPPSVAHPAPLVLEPIPRLSPVSIRSVGRGIGAASGAAGGFVVGAPTQIEAPRAPGRPPTLEATAWDSAGVVQRVAPAGAGGAERAPSHTPSAPPVHDPLEAMALRGLRELAGSLLPGQPLETTGDIAGLITKLHDSLEIFCRCFIPVREGCSRFVPPVDLERDAHERSRNRSATYLAVERAREPRALAAALLDWRQRSQDAPAAVENIFADLVFHQVALQEGVLKGARALLEELSPESIENSLDAAGSRGGLALFSGRYRALWESYAERHREFGAASEAFLELFGPEFARAYQWYWRRSTGRGEPSE